MNMVMKHRVYEISGNWPYDGPQLLQDPVPNEAEQRVSH
jgi:hypothetical protein